MKMKHINTITELTTFKAALGQFLDNVPDNPQQQATQLSAGILFRTGVSSQTVYETHDGLTLFLNLIKVRG